MRNERSGNTKVSEREALYGTRYGIFHSVDEDVARMGRNLYESGAFAHVGSGQPVNQLAGDLHNQEPLLGRYDSKDGWGRCFRPLS